MTVPRTGVNRRAVLQGAAAGGAVSLLAGPSPGMVAEGEKALVVVDTNVSLFPWPFRRLPLGTTDKLLTKMRDLGIRQAWAGSFDAVFHRDVATVNRRLAQECNQHRELVPIGSVNPMLPDWEDDLRRCFQDHGMPGVRLYPNYHGYTLADQRFTRLLSLATMAGRFVQVAALLEDTRTQHSQVRVPDVDLEPLADQVKQVPGARVQVLNWRPRADLLQKLLQVPGIYLDVARVDGTDGVPQLVAQVPRGRVLLGTHAPFLVPEAALIRLHESGQLPARALEDLLATDAARFLAKGVS